MAITSATTPSTADASPLLVRIGVAAALAVTGIVHLMLAPTYAAGSVVVGAAFVVGAVTAFAAAVWLLVKDSDMAWDLAAAVSAAMLVGLLVSATVGLFGIVTAQLTTSHIVAIATEIAVVAAWAATRLRRH